MESLVPLEEEMKVDNVLVVPWKTTHYWRRKSIQNVDTLCSIPSTNIRINADDDADDGSPERRLWLMMWMLNTSVHSVDNAIDDDSLIMMRIVSASFQAMDTFTLSVLTANSKYEYR